MIQPYPVRALRDIESQEDFEHYLKVEGLHLASTEEIPAEELISTSVPDGKSPPGCIISFKNSLSYLPIAKFVVSMCAPFIFEAERMRKGQILWVKHG